MDGIPYTGFPRHTMHTFGAPYSALCTPPWRKSYRWQEVVGLNYDERKLISAAKLGLLYWWCTREVNTPQHSTLTGLPPCHSCGWIPVAFLCWVWTNMDTRTYFVYVICVHLICAISCGFVVSVASQLSKAFIDNDSGKPVNFALSRWQA